MGKPAFKREHLEELHGYLRAQHMSAQRKDGRALIAARLAVTSFAAEHGDEATIAMAREIDFAVTLKQVYDEVKGG